MAKLARRVHLVHRPERLQQRGLVVLPPGDRTARRAPAQRSGLRRFGCDQCVDLTQSCKEQPFPYACYRWVS
jgi:hypothetical protein